MVRPGPHSDGPACIARLVHPIAMPLNVALLLTPLIVHNIVFNYLLVSSITPIPKGRNANCIDSVILLSSVFEVFGNIILNRYAEMLITSQHAICVLCLLNISQSITGSNKIVEQIQT